MTTTITSTDTTTITTEPRAKHRASDRHPVTQDPVEQRVIAACDTIRTYHARRPHDVARFVKEQLEGSVISDRQDEITELEERLDTLEEESREADNEILELRDARDHAVHQRDTAERQLSAANETIRNLEHQLHLLRTEGGTIASEED